MIRLIKYWILKKEHLLFLFLFFIMQPLFSVGYEYNANCMEAHNAIFRLQFNRAVGILTREKQLNPGNHIPVLLENTIDFLKVFCNEDSKDLEKFKNSRDKRLEFLEKGDKNDPLLQLVQSRSISSICNVAC